MLQLKNISYATAFPRKISIFENLTIEIPSKRNTVIYGDNGEGKTTLVKLMMKFIDPLEGEVSGGPEVAVSVFEDYDSQLFFSTVHEEFNSINYNNEVVYNETIFLLGLDKILGRSTFELSYSQKARLIFALAYLSDREFIILDCPPDDEKIDNMIDKIIKKQEKTIIMLLPGGSTRKLDGQWDGYLLKNKKLCKINVY